MAVMGERLSFYRGDTVVADMAMTEGGSLPLLSPITGATWDVATSPGSPSPVLSKSLGGGLEDLGGGTLRLTLTGAETAALPSGLYFQQLRATLLDGRTAVAMTGHVIVDQVVG
jgi:hypothetical protein